MPQNSFTDLEDSLNEKLSKDNVTDRGQITSKFQKLSELLVEIHSINSEELSKEDKKQRIQALMGNTEIKSFLDSITREVGEVKELLLNIIKKFGKELSEEAVHAVSSLETVIRDNQELNREEKKALQKEEGELKKEAGTIPQDKALTKTEQPGFFSVYRRIRKEGKEDSSKKVSIFSAIKLAFLEVSLSEESNEVIYEESRAEVEYQKQCEIAEKIKKCDEDYKKLGEQLKTVGKEIASSAKTAMSKARNIYDNAIKPVIVSEITPLKLASVINRIVSFSKNNPELGEWAKGLVSKIQEPELEVEIPISGMDR